MNIFNLTQEYLYLMSDIEEAGGEITDEIAERLQVNSEDFAEKMDAYASIIASYEGDIATIKTEQERLKGLATSKEKSIESMKKVMLIALELFGEVGKTGNKKYKTATHSYWNVYHKPLVVLDETMIPEEYIRYSLALKVNNNQMEEISDRLADVPLDLTFVPSVDRTALKKDIEAEIVSTENAYIDMNASYLRIT